MPGSWRGVTSASGTGSGAVGDRPAPPGRSACPGIVPALYSRYVEYQAERSPLRRRPLRIGLAVAYLALAALDFADGAVPPQPRVRDFVFGTLFTALSVLFGPVMSRLLDRVGQRMKRLRRQVRERYPDW